MSLVLAAILLLFCGRAVVDCLSTLVLSPFQGSAKAADRPWEAGAVDRKPKPTRQQERTSMACLELQKGMPPSKPLVPAALGWAWDSLLPKRPLEDWSTGFDGVQATRPSYLRPSEIALQGQLPPPSFTVA